jgi:Fe-S cluster biogenesis protein NfuA
MPDERQIAAPAPPRDVVEAAIDRLRPALVADGGNIEVLGVDPDGTVRVVMQGTCASCPAQTATLRYGLEEPLRQALPGITALVVF